MTYVIAEPCVDLKDKACIEECPVDCTYEGARMRSGSAAASPNLHRQNRSDDSARPPTRRARGSARARAQAR